MPALDARRVKLTIFFPIDDPLSIDDALSGSSSRGGFVISSSAAAALRRLDAQVDALGRLDDQARLRRGGGDSGSAIAKRAVCEACATLSTERRLLRQQDVQV